MSSKETIKKVKGFIGGFWEWPIWKPFQWLFAAIAAYYVFGLIILIPVALVFAFARAWGWPIAFWITIILIAVLKNMYDNSLKRDRINELADLANARPLKNVIDIFGDNAYHVVLRMESDEGITLTHKERYKLISSLTKSEYFDLGSLSPRIHWNWISEEARIKELKEIKRNLSVEDFAWLVDDQDEYFAEIFDEYFDKESRVNKIPENALDLIRVIFIFKWDLYDAMLRMEHYERIRLNRNEKDELISALMKQRLLV